RLLILCASTAAPLLISFFFYVSRPHLYLHSFPTRRSSDLLIHQVLGDVMTKVATVVRRNDQLESGLAKVHELYERAKKCSLSDTDRKSTRLNSSHVSISYAVFCVKKKKK